MREIKSSGVQAQEYADKVAEANGLDEHIKNLLLTAFCDGYNSASIDIKDKIIENIKTIW